MSIELEELQGPGFFMFFQVPENAGSGQSGGMLVLPKSHVNKDMELFKMVINVINVIQR